MKFEVDIILFLQSGINEQVATVFRIITLFGSWLGLAFALIFLFFKRKSLSYALVLTFFVGGGLNRILKKIIQRPRPFDAFGAILNLDGGDGFSMPSGHACASVILATFIGYWAIKYGKTKATKILVPIICALYAILVCLSRLMLGQHYLTDLIAGSIEGVIVALFGIIVYNFIIKRMTHGKANQTEINHK